MCAGTSMDGQTVSLLRREDMAVLDFTFSNISRSGAAGQVVLTPTAPALPATVTVHFPPQSVLEQVTSGPTTAVKRVRYAGESTLTFRVPPGAAVPFTADGLLTWAGLAPDAARLECVWGLFLGPVTADAVWRHPTSPVQGSGGAVGLWHTRIAPKASPVAGGGPVGLRSVAAARVAQPDYDSSLTPVNRQQITAAADANRPLTANALALSALGASVDLVGKWDPALGLGITAYQHRATVGRDVAVQVDERGYLLPFGFPVQITARTERSLGAGLVKSYRLTVLAPEITYDGVAALPSDGRAFPFTRIRLNRPLDTEFTVSDPLGAVGYWLNRADEPSQRLLFDITAEDRYAHRIGLTVPFVFVYGHLAHQPAQLTGALGLYENIAANLPLPATGRLTLAPVQGSTSETSTVDVAELRIGARPSTAQPGALLAAGRLGAVPRLLSAGARIPALDAMTPGAGAAGTVRGLTLDPDYIANGLAYTHQVYASLQDPVNFTPPPADSGGVAALGLPVRGLSADTGLVGGSLAAVKSGTFNPADYLRPTVPGVKLPTRLLGVINLTELVPGGLDITGDGTTAPRILTTVERPGGGPPVCVRTELTWQPPVAGRTVPPLTMKSDGALELHGTTVARFDGTPPFSEIRGELRNFTLDFAGVLAITFDRVAFTVKPGAAPALDARIQEVGFSGDLAFLNKLREYLPSCAGGPRVVTRPDGIEVGYGLAVPTVNAGIFLLQNLTLSTTVFLPFTEKAVEAKFAVSSPDHPFLVTVSLLGGGGCFSVTLQSGAVTALDAQLQFGAAAALDLGIASGSVSITAGIFIHLEAGKSKLTGFFRAVGALDVLGIISVSVEFYLQLGTEQVPKPGLPGHSRTDVVGEASVTVRVRVALFSQSVSLTVRRRFGGGGDPSYLDAFPAPSAWSRRCAAYADMEDAA
ncbi:hypothetical protein ACFYXL_21750 [Streptomyces tsukubensis]|uniref:hypothetical protein n=1 Tax=Streptomyces tsukubensis TaxID=83656 RepID=UPI0036C730BE